MIATYTATVDAVILYSTLIISAYLGHLYMSQNRWPKARIKRLREGGHEHARDLIHMAGGCCAYAQDGSKTDAAPRRQAFVQQFQENPPVAGVPGGVKGCQAHAAMVSHIQMARSKFQVVVQSNQHFGAVAADDAA